MSKSRAATRVPAVRDGWRLLIRKDGTAYACLLDKFYSIRNVDHELLSAVWKGCDGRKKTESLVATLVRGGYERSNILRTLEALERAGIIVDRTSVALPSTDLLSSSEIERHDRQIHYWSGFEPLDSSRTRYDYQINLRRSSVTIIGAGGIGSWTAATLGLTGIGRIRAVDPDRVELSNLNRQVLYRDADVGRFKVDAAGDALRERNPDLTYEPIAEGIWDVESAIRCIDGTSFVALTADHPPRMLRRWVAEACHILGIPYALFGAVLMGPLAVPGKAACFGCYETLLRSKDDDYDDFVDQISVVPAVKSAPTFLGPIAAGLMCKDVIHFLADAPVTPSTLGHILRVDPTTNETSRLAIPRAADCQFCARSAAFAHA